MKANRKPITLTEAPAILSKWRHLRKTGLPSDRELVGALLACVERLNELGEFDPERAQGDWGTRVRQ